MVGLDPGHPTASVSEQVTLDGRLKGAMTKD